MIRFFAVALTLALAACAASAPRIDPARLDSLSKGKSTYDDVVRQFGKPSVISNNIDGTRTARYLYAPEGDAANTMVPLLSTSQGASTTFEFDTKGVLTDYRYTAAVRQAVAQPSAASAAAAPAAAAPQPAGAKPAAKTADVQPAAPKKPLPPNVTDRWPGSTTENR